MKDVDDDAAAADDEHLCVVESTPLIVFCYVLAN